MTKKVRMFAGPNGSGKSTLIEEIGKQYNLGFFINADDIKHQLDVRKYIDCSSYYPTTLTQNDWTDFLNENKNIERVNESVYKKLSITENLFVCSQPIDSYDAALMATFFRAKLLKKTSTFSFETVMSHESKVTFLNEAKNAGFKTYFYFICTQDPEINIQRVINRAKKGGHDVNKDKIVNRYYRSLELLYAAFKSADRAFIIDNTGVSRTVLIEKKGNEIFFHEEHIPEWAAVYLLDRL